MNNTSETSALETAALRRHDDGKQQAEVGKDDGGQKTGLPSEAAARGREDTQLEPALLQKQTKAGPQVEDRGPTTDDGRGQVESSISQQPTAPDSSSCSYPDGPMASPSTANLPTAGPPTDPSSVLSPPPSVLPETTSPPSLPRADASVAAPALPPPSSDTARPSSEVRPEELSSVIGKIRVLSADEREAYRQCEAIVRDGWEKWFQAGLALAQINHDDLYREEFNSFEDYCQKRWGIHRTRAYGLMDAAKLAQILASDPDVPRPDHESSLRPLVPLTVGQAKLVWQCAAATSAGRPITARLVKATMRTLEIDSRKKVPARVRINKSEQRTIVNQVLEELIVLITGKAAHSDLLQKAELLHHRLQELFAPRKPKVK